MKLIASLLFVAFVWAGWAGGGWLRREQGAPLSPTRRLLVAGGVLAMLVAGIFLLLLMSFPTEFLTFPLKRNSGSFDRQAMEAIVAQVRNAGLEPGEKREFLVRNLAVPGTLEPLMPDTYLTIGTNAGHVWAEVSAAGQLKVVIETRDLGHAGEYGFAYSDIPLVPESYGEGSDWLTVDVPGHLMLVQPQMKIDDHWWEILNNLN